MHPARISLAIGTALPALWRGACARLQAFARAAGALCLGRHGWLLAACVAALVALTRWCPSTRVGEHEVVGELTAISRVPGMVQQLQDPSVGLANGRRFGSYLYFATRWRHLPPFIGHALRLSPTVYLRSTSLGAWWLLLLGTWYAARLGGAGAAWLAAVALASSSAWLSAAELVQFDGWVWSLLLIASFAPRRLTAWVAIALGPWVDERCIFFVPLALLIRLVRDRDLPWREATGLVPYAVARLVALHLGDTPLQGQLALTHRNWTIQEFVKGWGVAWRFGWIVLAAGGWKTIASLQPARRWLALGAGAGVAAVAPLAIDYTRTAAGLLPLAVLGAVNITSWTPWWRRIAVAAVLLNLLLPYWHMYGDAAPVLSIFSPPPGTWVMPFQASPVD